MSGLGYLLAFVGITLAGTAGSMLDETGDVRWMILIGYGILLALLGGALIGAARLG